MIVLMLLVKANKSADIAHDVIAIFQGIIEIIDKYRYIICMKDTFRNVGVYQALTSTSSP